MSSVRLRLGRGRRGGFAAVATGRRPERSTHLGHRGGWARAAARDRIARLTISGRPGLLEGLYLVSRFFDHASLSRRQLRGVRSKRRRRVLAWIRLEASAGVGGKCLRPVT